MDIVMNGRIKSFYTASANTGEQDHAHGNNPGTYPASHAMGIWGIPP